MSVLLLAIMLCLPINHADKEPGHPPAPHAPPDRLIPEKIAIEHTVKLPQKIAVEHHIQGLDNLAEKLDQFTDRAAMTVVACWGILVVAMLLHRLRRRNQ